MGKYEEHLRKTIAIAADSFIAAREYGITHNKNEPRMNHYMNAKLRFIKHALKEYAEESTNMSEFCKKIIKSIEDNDNIYSDELLKSMYLVKQAANW